MIEHKASRVEVRMFRVGIGLVLLSAIPTWTVFGTRAGLSFLAGAALSTANLFWLWRTIRDIVFQDLKRSKQRVLAGFLLRLLLLPLMLYVMIRFLFLNVSAAVAGLAVFSCGVFVEGILEAFESSPKRRARAERSSHLPK